MIESAAQPPSRSSAPDDVPLRILYITSRGHSGSTLLDLLISGHSAIASVGELKMLAEVDSRRKLCSCHGLEPQVCPYWHSVEQRLRVSVGLRFDDLRLDSPDPWINHCHNLALYESVAAVSGCRTIVDSSKGLPRLRDLLQGVDLYGGYELVPIHLLRGSLGLVHSYVKNGRIRSDLDLADVCYNYTSNVFRTEALLDGRPHLFVRYERLARAPRRELQRIMAQLAMPFEEDQLDWGRGPRRNIHGNDMRFRAGGSIRPDRSWRRGLTPGQILRVIWFTLPVRLSWLGRPSRSLMDAWRRRYKPSRAALAAARAQSSTPA